MDKVFADLISKFMEVYVDDMEVNTSLAEDDLADLEKVFIQIRAYDMRLNPDKCFFGVEGGKFLGFLITKRGIEVNPDKCEAITSTGSLTIFKYLQQLNGKLTSLSWFIPKKRRRQRPFFDQWKVQRNLSGINSVKRYVY